MRIALVAAGLLAGGIALAVLLPGFLSQNVPPASSQGMDDGDVRRRAATDGTDPGAEPPRLGGLGAEHPSLAAGEYLTVGSAESLVRRVRQAGALVKDLRARTTSDVELTVASHQLLRSNAESWRRLIVDYVLALDSGHLAGLGAEDGDAFVEWALWVSDFGEGFQPLPEKREAFRDALRRLRASPPDIERWDVMEMAASRLLRDLYRDVSLQEAASLGADPAATLDEFYMAFRGHAPSSFETPELTAMVLRMADKGQVFSGACIRPLVERGELDPSIVARLDDAMLERAEEGKLYAAHVTQTIVPYLRVTGRGAWRDAVHWLDRAERAGQLSLVAAIFPHLDPPPPTDEVRRALEWDVPDAVKDDLRKAFDLQGD